jgi:hypothetical protein
MPVSGHRDGRHRGVYRTDEQALPMLVLAGLFAVLAAFSVYLYATDKTHPGFLGLAAANALVAAGFLRVGVCDAFYDDRGLRVRNPLRTISVPWDQIESFSLSRKGFTWGTAAVRRRDGKEIRIWAIQKPNASTRPNNTNAEELIDCQQEPKSAPGSGGEKCTTAAWCRASGGGP